VILQNGQDKHKEHESDDGPHDLAHGEAAFIDQIQAGQHDEPDAVEDRHDGQHDLIGIRRKEAHHQVGNGKDADESADEINQVHRQRVVLG
jgi:hypothetical protein